MRTKSPLPIALAALLAITAVGCGGDSANSSEATSTTPTKVATTVPKTAMPTTVAAPSTTAAPQATYPLTGLPVPDDLEPNWPAMVVKIDNHRSARPQSGLNAADIVFEEIVEVQTRFAAVFHSQGSDPVGPIRSGRTQDVDMLGSFDRPLFVWSGGNTFVTRTILKSDLIDLSAQHNEVYKPGGFHRNQERRAPHDLYAQTSLLWTLTPPDANPPPPQFEFLGPDDEFEGTKAVGVDLDMDGLEVTWRYHTGRKVYLRTSDGEVHEDAASGQVNCENVVVVVVDYRRSEADANSPEAQTIGTGEVWVFSAGRFVKGTWTRVDRLAPFVLTDESGDPIALTPGRTWIELARADTFEAVAR